MMDTRAPTWEGEDMPTPRSKKTLPRILLWFGVIYAVAVTVLIIVGVMGPGLWITVAAMVLLAVSQWMTLRSIDRTAPKADADGAEASRT